MKPFARLSPRQDLLVSALLLGLWSAWMLVKYWNEWPPDLSALYIASRFYGAGEFDLVYAAPDGFFGATVESWKAKLAELGYADASTFPFVYPPIWAALASFWDTSPHAFFNTFYVLHIAMIAASVWLAYRIARPECGVILWTGLSIVLLSLSVISISALFHNQLQITVTFLILLAFERYRAGAMATAGIALGFAAAIKISPAVLGLIFLVDREYRAALATAFAGLVLLCLSVVIAGTDLHWVFLQRLQDISGQIAIQHVNWNIENLSVQLHALITGTSLGPTPLSVTTSPDHLPITLLNAAVLILGLVWIFRRDRPLPIKLTCLILLTTLTSPLAWSHHYLPVLLLIPTAYTFLTFRNAIAFGGVFACLTSLGVFAFSDRLGDKIHPQSVYCTILMILTLLLFLKAEGDSRH